VKKTPVCLLIVLCLAIVNTTAWAGGDIEKGAKAASVCMGCHGPDGISVNPLWPNLAGQHEAYLLKQMTDYRDGRRVDVVMAAFVDKLSDEDIRNIAAFYASRKLCK
jgi:cytochrome c553